MVRLLHLLQPWNVFNEGVEPAITIETAPMVLTMDGQNCVSESQFCLGDVAAEKVSVFAFERGASETFSSEEQSGAAIHEQPRGFRNGNEPGIAVMFTTLQQRIIAYDAAMPHDKVVIEHAGGASTQPRDRASLEFNIETRQRSELLAAMMETGLVLPLTCERGCVQQDVKFEIVVGTVSFVGS